MTRPERSNRLRRLIFCVCAAGSSVVAEAADFYTRSAAEIQTALQSAAPGDSIVMANGNWTDQVITFSGNGNAANPITLRAETPGRVVLNGTSRLSITGNYLVASGLNFRGGAIAEGSTVVRFTSSSTNSRFTNSSIIDYNPLLATTRYHWVGIQGQDNRVDGNFFRGQNHSGVTVTVLPVVGTPSRARIDGNHFVDRPSGSGNGFETIRIGTSDVQGASTQVVVERNLFERTDGEMETVSNKTSDNIYRYNTFRDVEGTLSLRHGKRCLVESNFFLGQTNQATGAIRVMGSDHIVRNNFIADVGNRANGAIALNAGDTDFSPSGGTNTNGYEPVVNVQVVNNTIINSREAAIKLDELYGNSSTQTVRPSNVTIANNLIYNTQTALIKGTEGTGFTWAGNIAFGNALGISARSGITQLDPLASRSGIELYRLASNSPAINTAASGAWTAPTDDMDGQLRSSPLDVGADEAGPDSSIVRRALWGADVGPTWLNRRSYDSSITETSISSRPVLRFEAENFTARLDPNANGTQWQVVTTEGRTVLKAPVGAIVTLPGVQDAVAEYDVAFHDSGTYYLMALVRAMDTSSDSLYAPATLGADPTVTRTVPVAGIWVWVDLGSYSVTASQLNLPLTLKIGRREQSIEIDSFRFSTSSARPFPVIPEPSGAGLLLTIGAVATVGRRR